MISIFSADIENIDHRFENIPSASNSITDLSVLIEIEKNESYIMLCAYDGQFNECSRTCITLIYDSFSDKT